VRNKPPEVTEQLSCFFLDTFCNFLFLWIAEHQQIMWTAEFRCDRQRILSGRIGLHPAQVKARESRLAPFLGIWSTNDHTPRRRRHEEVGSLLERTLRYEQIDGASHWIPLDAPDRLNQLLIEWLG
jgi:pimeloyl-ACP methyl ester carboxylesterase